MPQNTTSNKFSSFIGITLLIAVIAFTVFINFSTEKEVSEIEEEIYFEPFSEYDVANFWRLKDLQTDSITVSQNGENVHIKINKNLEITTYNPLESAIFDKLDDSIKQYVEETYKDYSGGTAYMNYGILAFKNAYNNNQDDRVIFEDVEISYLNNTYADTSRLIEIGGLFVEYQIQSIDTESTYGDFTHITLKDGRELFLIKENAEVKDESYKNLLENAEYLNDSTRIILPWN